MTDMDEIRGLVGDYGAAEFRAGRFVESGSTTRSAACRDADDKRSALLQRVETLRAERDAALAAQKRAEEERDEEHARAERQKTLRHECEEASYAAHARAEAAEASLREVGERYSAALNRAEAAESALAALRAAPRGCTACGSGFRNAEEWRAVLAPAPPAALWALSGAWRLRVAGYSTDLGTPHGTEAMVYRRCAAELDAALAPSPPETPAPEDACGGYESGCSCDGCIRRETEHLAWIERVRARRGAAPASPAFAPSRGSGDGSYEWAYTESLDILQAALDGLPEAEADLPMPRMARQAAAAIMRLRGAPSPTSTDPGAEVKS